MNQKPNHMPRMVSTFCSSVTEGERLLLFNNDTTELENNGHVNKLFTHLRLLASNIRKIIENVAENTMLTVTALN